MSDERLRAGDEVHPIERYVIAPFMLLFGWIIVPLMSLPGMVIDISGTYYFAWKVITTGHYPDINDIKRKKH